MKVYSIINNYLDVSDRNIVFNLKERNGINSDIHFRDGKVAPDDVDTYELYKQYDVFSDSAMFDMDRDIVVVLLDIKKPVHRNLNLLVKTDRFILSPSESPDLPKDSYNKPILLNSSVFIKSMSVIGRVVYMDFDGNGSWRIEVRNASGVCTTLKLPDSKEDILVFGYDNEL